MKTQDYYEFKLIQVIYFDNNNYYSFENGILYDIKKKKLLIPKATLQNEQNKENNIYEYVNQPSGLINYGHSCFINALLQCLINCVPMTKYFLTNYHKENNNIFSNIYLDFIKKYQKKDLYAAKGIINYFLSYDSSIKNTGSDSKDVLFDFCDKIQSELKYSEISIIIDESTNPEDEKSVIDERKKLDNADYSIIYECFNFWIENVQRCSNNRCPKFNKNLYELRSESYFNFYLSEIYSKKYSNYSNSYSGKRKKYIYKLSLDDCFNYYLFEKGNCSFCKNNMDIKNKICKLPNILIIILNRGKNNLFNVNIEFNQELYLNKYYQKLKYNISELKNESCLKYNLLCGTILLKDYYNPGKGHTIAFATDYHGKYNIYDDDKISNGVDFQRIKGEDAYILFYQKEKNL